MDKTKLLFLHQETTFFVQYNPLRYFTPFFKTTIICILNYYFGSRKVLLDHIQGKQYFLSRGSQCFFQRFYFLMKPFVYKSLEWCVTGSLFATSPLCNSLLGVDFMSARVWNHLCVYDLLNNT